MLILSVIRTQVSRLIQRADATYLTKIDDWVNQRYDDVLRRAMWPQLRRTTTFTTVSGVATVILPKDIEYILEIQDRVNDRSLAVVDPSVASRTMVDIQDVQDIPHAYWLEDDTVAVQPTAASLLSVSSGSAADTSQKVRVWGVSGGQDVTETVTLNGTTAVPTANSYTRVDRVSKDGNTTGTITVTANSGAVTVVTLAPTEYTARSVKIHLVKIPNAVITYNMTYRYKPPRLIYDEDVPVIPCHNVLIRGAYAQALEEQRQFQKATVAWEHYEADLQTLISEFMQQADGVTLFVPQVERDRLDRPVY